MLESLKREEKQSTSFLYAKYPNLSHACVRAYMMEARNMYREFLRGELLGHFQGMMEAEYKIEEMRNARTWDICKAILLGVSIATLCFLIK